MKAIDDITLQLQGLIPLIFIFGVIILAGVILYCKFIKYKH